MKAKKLLVAGLITLFFGSCKKSIDILTLIPHKILNKITNNKNILK
jgi:hypothetical protein